MFGIPLAPFALIVSVLLAAYEAYQIHNTLTSTDWPSTSAYIALTLQIIQLVIAVVGFISVPTKWATGVSFLVIGFKFILFAFIFSFVGMWILWIMKMCGKGETNEKWKPSREDIVVMSVTSAVTVLLIILSWWISSAIGSLRKVFAAGGNGWEGKNYREIKTGGKKTMVHSDSTLSSDTV